MIKIFNFKILASNKKNKTSHALLKKCDFDDQDELKMFNKGGGKIAEHPDTRLPGIEIVSGSLGHGLGIGSGIALSSKLNNKEKDFFTSPPKLGSSSTSITQKSTTPPSGLKVLKVRRKNPALLR